MCERLIKEVAYREKERESTTPMIFTRWLVVL
jgi:hypothetical protein